MYNHVNPKVNDKLKEWMNCNDDKQGEANYNRRKVNEYVGMTLYFTEKAMVNINMDDYFERMINGFPMKTSNIETELTTAGNNLFEKGNSKRMGK